MKQQLKKKKEKEVVDDEEVGGGGGDYCNRRCRQIREMMCLVQKTAFFTLVYNPPTFVLSLFFLTTNPTTFKGKDHTVCCLT